MAWAFMLVAAAWVGFAYVGYPLALWWLSRSAPEPAGEDVPGDAAFRPPSLSLIIAVHNGAAHLARKLDATLALKSPGELEILVTSDGSTDETNAIAERYVDRAVVLVRNAERRGKEAAQAAAIARAQGEILIFTDVTAELEEEALIEIVRPFADPRVGCVSSEDRVDSEGGEGAYVRFEMALRRLESRATSLVGLSGSFFAVRRSLCSPWPSDLASDFRSALESGRRGFRAVSAEKARARFRAPEDPAAEWSRKVRTVRRGMAVLSAYRELLHPRHGRLAFTLWGHKVARFTSPVALLILLGASAGAAGSGPVAAGLLLAQLAAYGLGALSLFVPRVGAWRLPRLMGFFLLVNASMLVAWLHHLRGRRAVLWQPTAR